MPYVMNDLDDIRIHDEFAGNDGPPLVFYHDSTTPSAIWRHLGYVARLAEDYRVILIDARGHGRSDKPHEEAAYSMALIVSDVVAVLDRAGVERAHGLRLHAPERFDSLIISGAPFAPTPEAILTRTTMPVLLFAGQHDSNHLRESRLAAKRLPNATSRVQSQTRVRLCGKAGAGGWETLMLKHREVADWLDERQERFITISDTIWEFAEVALAETKSCALQAGDLEADGFRITRNVGGLPTAFSAEWGEGWPVIGFLGEYDALPELSQKSQAAQEPLVTGGAGHGCGHNLLGTASLAAASALKAWLQATGRPGTVRYYGCPAEETGAGKVFMARGGAFEGLDAALTWHPGSHTSVMLGSSLAIDHITFRFFGKTAHAAGAPEMGRSALDAVELTNIGVNFLREHVIDSARIHYVITNGGGQPNVVPAEAEVWYYVRAPRRDLLDPITQRVIKIAEAATQMTETRLEVHDFYGVHNYLPNVTLGQAAMDVLEALGPIEFTAEEEAYAMQVSEAFGETARIHALERAGMPKTLANRALIGEPHQPSDVGKTMSGSTDVSEASWNAPTLQLWSTCFALGAPGHSWAITATGQMSIGHKGMLHAAKAMAVTAAQLFDDPRLLARAKAEFDQLTDGYTYRAAIPEGAEPPQPYIRS